MSATSLTEAQWLQKLIKLGLIEKEKLLAALRSNLSQVEENSALGQILRDRIMVIGVGSDDLQQWLHAPETTASELQGRVAQLLKGLLINAKKVQKRQNSPLRSNLETLVQQYRNNFYEKYRGDPTINYSVQMADGDNNPGGTASGGQGFPDTNVSPSPYRTNGENERPGNNGKKGDNGRDDDDQHRDGSNHSYGDADPEEALQDAIDALIHAISFGKEDEVKEILEKSDMKMLLLSTQSKKYHGNTALHAAYINKGTSIIEIIKEYCTDDEYESLTRIKNDNHKTPLDLQPNLNHVNHASTKQKTEKPKTNKTTQEGETVVNQVIVEILIHNAGRGMYGLVKEILDRYGIHYLFYQNQHGDTALHTALLRVDIKDYALNNKAFRAVYNPMALT